MRFCSSNGRNLRVSASKFLAMSAVLWTQYPEIWKKVIFFASDELYSPLFDNLKQDSSFCG